MAYAALIKSGRLYGTGLREQLHDDKYLLLNKFTEENFDADIDKIFIKDDFIAVIDIHKNLYIKTFSQKYFQFVQTNVSFISGESIDDFAIINDKLDIISNKRGFLGSGFVRVCYSHNNLCAIDINGNLWGSGELFGDSERFYPINNRIKFVQIYCDNKKFLGLDSEGHIHALGDFTDLGLVESPEILSELTVIKFDEKIMEFAIGETFCFFIAQNHDLYGCGNAGFLGIGYYDYDDDNLVAGINHIKTEGKVRQVACGKSSAYILTIDGKLFVCGENTYGQLGIGSLLPVPSQFDGDFPGKSETFYDVYEPVEIYPCVKEQGEDEKYICDELPYDRYLLESFEFVDIDGIDNLFNRERLPSYFGSTKSARSK